MKRVVEDFGWRWGEVEWVQGPKNGKGWFFPGFVGE